MTLRLDMHSTLEVSSRRYRQRPETRCLFAGGAGELRGGESLIIAVAVVVLDLLLYCISQ